jgi:thiamine biosynthesis lipoprotein
MKRKSLVKFTSARKQWVYFLPLLLLIACAGGDKKQPEHSFNGSTMGTSYHITIVGDSLAVDERSRIANEVDSFLDQYNQVLSTYEAESEISQFNREATTSPILISNELARVVEVGLNLCQQSNGAFDITVMPIVNFFGFGIEEGENRFPTINEIDAWLELTGCDKIELKDSTISKLDPRVTIDLSAIAKGEASDLVSDFLYSLGYQNLYVEIGGEIMTRGLNRYGKPWKIGIDRPTFGGVPGADLHHIVQLSDQAIATSGDYRNYKEVMGRRISHMIDPRTGSPISHNLASVTVITDQCMYADGIATAVMVLGAEAGLDWLEAYPNAEGLLITREENGEYRELMTSGFEKYIVK